MSYLSLHRLASTNVRLRLTLIFGLTGTAVLIAYLATPRYSCPQYCLLAFGPEARTRVWIVWDGDIPFIHRNGDLRQRGERLAYRTGDWASANLPGKWSTASTEILGDDGTTRYAVELVRGAAREDASGWRQSSVYVRVHDYTQMDEVELAENPEEAPELYFGPLTIMLEYRYGGQLQHLEAGDKPNDLRAWIGTFQTAHGRAALVSHHRGGIPIDVHPVADIEFPNASAGRPPIKVRYTLDDRC